MFDNQRPDSHDTAMPVVRFPIQRACDVLASAAGLVLLSPVFLIVATSIVIVDGGSVLYRSRRVGQGGRLFSIYKFRSMVQGADKMGGGITTKGDQRVTRVGRVLRKYKLDERPQLFNVLKGDMSFVGARPEDPRYVAHYTPDQRKILAYRPGITSPASLQFRHEEEILAGDRTEQLYLERILPQKLSLDLDYLSRRTIWSDLRIILQTIGGLS